MSGDPITRAADAIAAHLTAVYGYSEVDPMAAARVLAEAGLLRTEADWEDERYQAELHAELDRLRARTEADQAVLDAADAAASGWHSTNNDFIEAMDALVDAVAARRAVREADS